MKELTVVSVKSNPFSFPKAFLLLEAMHGKYNYENLGIKIYNLNEYKSAFQALRMGVVTKSVFKIASD